MGYNPTRLYVDEDGSLVQCSEFCKAVIHLDMVLNTTGGGNSLSNGKVERQHQTQGDMVHCFLAMAKIIIMGKNLTISIQKLWCFAFQHACYVSRFHYNQLCHATPYELVFGKKLSANQLAVFGLTVTIVDAHKDQHRKLSDYHASTTCYFMQFGNHPTMLIYKLVVINYV